MSKFSRLIKFAVKVAPVVYPIIKKMIDKKAQSKKTYPVGGRK